MEKPEQSAQRGRHSGIPDYSALRLCPDAPGFLNLIPGTWTGTQLPRHVEFTKDSRELQAILVPAGRANAESAYVIASEAKQSPTLGVEIATVCCADLTMASGAP
jgi:hypothetical protein